MCLGIPGQVVELVRDNDQLALVDVAGAHRQVNTGLLDPGALAPGDWVLVHMGFVMEKVDRDRARRALDGLQTMGRPDEGIDRRTAG
ncbi:HypC/HybG/HupF family hydrogenase formation chaperone [Nocardiopsis salina]|uniref:HypC/HybG/HupF family hydrogenase formation chaperone n=1 Tax=Nocardiopsis salina TaxID=245836 RepID=UPI000349306B|nr:HypC/HybG/HupF family hydrogenase formation chaperone [Nocardiopsis salina]